MQLTTMQRLQKARYDLIGHDAFIAMSGVLMVGTYSADPNLPTACTDGKNEIYGEQFVAKCSLAELRWTVAHENFHKMLLHLNIWLYLFEKDAECANKAADYVINLFLKDIEKTTNGFIKAPHFVDILCDERFRGMDTKQVFDILYKEKQESGSSSDDSDSGSSDDDNDSGSSGGSSGGQESFDQHDYQNAKKLSADEKEAVKNQIEDAVRQGKIRAEKAGVEKGELERMLETLGEPKVDWREQLRLFISKHVRGSDMSSFRRPRRRMFASGIYLPHTYSERIDDVMCANDVSGSTYAFQEQFRSEIQSIIDKVKPKRMDYIDWDTSVQTHEIIEDGKPDEMLKLPVAGGGGTSVECVSSYIKERRLEPTVLVILTDGHLSGGWGEWPKKTNVLWCIFGNKSARPPVGAVIHIDKES